MDLQPGVVAGMVKAAQADDTAIICHSTLNTKQQAVCRGFFDRCKTTPLQLAERLGVIEFDAPKKLV